jgi:hypothetical protein
VDLFTGVLASLFADDVEVYASNKKLAFAEDTAQQALDAVVKWSKKWKLQISVKKCESSFFYGQRRCQMEPHCGSETTLSPSTRIRLSCGSPTTGR